jgi:opacity protein-like surface antigen
MSRILLAVLIGSLGIAGTAQAQRSRQSHEVKPPARWVINGHSVAALGTSVGDGEPDDIKTSAGLGAGVQVGYLISSRVTAYAGFELAKQGMDLEGVSGNVGLTHLEAGAKLSFPVRNSRVLPYIGGWVGRRSLSTTLEDLDTGLQADVSASGLAVGGMGGLQYAVSPNLSLDGALSLGIGKMDNVKVGGQTTPVPNFNNTTTTRLQFGANWYP